MKDDKKFFHFRNLLKFGIFDIQGRNQKLRRSRIPTYKCLPYCDRHKAPFPLDKSEKGCTKKAAITFKLMPESYNCFFKTLFNSFCLSCCIAA